MYKEVEVKLRPDQVADPDALSRAAAKSARVRGAFDHRILRRSVDARGREPVFRLRVGVAQDQPLPPPDDYRAPYVSTATRPSVYIIGAGPAGYFAALTCIERGLRPVVLDRGKDVRARRRDLRAIQQEGIVNPHSNYCFGEGGAGTYSDGKLYTRSHKRGSITKVLHLLVEHGAQPDILVDAHPHIGSNKLPGIIAAMRATIETYGGEVRFGAHVVDISTEDGALAGLTLADGSRDRYQVGHPGDGPQCEGHL